MADSYQDQHARLRTFLKGLRVGIYSPCSTLHGLKLTEVDAISPQILHYYRITSRPGDPESWTMDKLQHALAALTRRLFEDCDWPDSSDVNSTYFTLPSRPSGNDYKGCLGYFKASGTAARLLHKDRVQFSKEVFAGFVHTKGVGIRLVPMDAGNNPVASTNVAVNDQATVRHDLLLASRNYDRMITRWTAETNIAILIHQAQNVIFHFRLGSSHSKVPGQKPIGDDGSIEGTLLPLELSKDATEAFITTKLPFYPYHLEPPK